MNLQNIPARDEYGKRFRECFISGNGRSFIVADYSQAEIRIVAALSKSDTLITALNNNEDPYSTIATVMFNKPVSKTENKNLRDIAKSILLGLNYGMGASKLSETINCSLNEAKAHITKFRKANPNLVDFLDRCNKYGVRNRVAYSMRPFSRPRFFDVPRDESEVARIGRQSQNHPIQSTNADITKYALVLIYNKLNELGLMYDTRIVNTVHDEIIVETSDDRAELVCKIVEECMTKAGNSVIDSVNMSSTANISKKWDK